MQGLLLFDKPAGITSRYALQRLCRLVDKSHSIRAGHLGTLDPFATGLLPLIFGETTRFAFGLESADKTYHATIQFGGSSTTDDCQGTCTLAPPVPSEKLTHCYIESLLKTFTGNMTQVPPYYSAIKIQGRRLYTWARQHDKILQSSENACTMPKRPLRQIRIDYINLLHIDVASQQMEIMVHCSRGTYIRSLARDLGTALGSGGYLLALRRIAVGRFTISQSITQEQWGEAVQHQTWSNLLLPTKSLVQDWPYIVVSSHTARRLYCGQRIAVDKNGCIDDNKIPSPLSLTDQRYQLYDKHLFIGMGECIRDADGTMILHPRKMLPHGQDR